MLKYLTRLYYRLRSNYTTEHLISRGLKVGDNFLRMHDVILDPSHCWLIEIGHNVTMAPRVHILAHDASTKLFLGYTKIGNVKIGSKVFIGADSVILPSVIIGDNVVIGANSTVSNNLASNGVYAGSPAKYICSIESYIERHEQLMRSSPIYEEQFTISKNITKDQKLKMYSELEHGHGYIR